MNQIHFDTSEICYQLGIRDAVFSPGSRNAPLSISFSRHPHLRTRVVVDERSAGFIALGIAQHTKDPSSFVVLLGRLCSTMVLRLQKPITVELR